MRLWKCSQNWWRHCKIVSFCMNTLDLWCQCIMYQYMSKLFGEELKYKDLLFLQRNSDGSHASYSKPYNWKLTFSSFLAKDQAAFLTVQSVILWSMSTCSFETGLIPFHNTPLRCPRTSISYNKPCNRHLQYIMSASLLKIKRPLWLQCY